MRLGSSLLVNVYKQRLELQESGALEITQKSGPIAFRCQGFRTINSKGGEVPRAGVTLAETEMRRLVFTGSQHRGPFSTSGGPAGRKPCALCSACMWLRSQGSSRLLFQNQQTHLQQPLSLVPALRPGNVQRAEALSMATGPAQRTPVHPTDAWSLESRVWSTLAGLVLHSSVQRPFLLPFARKVSDALLPALRLGARLWGSAR